MHLRHVLTYGTTPVFGPTTLFTITPVFTPTSLFDIFSKKHGRVRYTFLIMAPLRAELCMPQSFPCAQPHRMCKK
jgi:hypothetical protein